MTSAIINQQHELPPNFQDVTKKAKTEIRCRRRQRQKECLEELRSSMSRENLRANDIAPEVGASNWLTTLPIGETGFVLNKREFWDAISLRYNWKLRNLPATCVCV